MKPEKIKEMPTGQLFKDLFLQNLDNIILEGLKRKGFEFENPADLEEFIKTRCNRTIDEALGDETYYIDDTPFLLYEKNIGGVNGPVTTPGRVNYFANLGHYTFL